MNMEYSELIEGMVELKVEPKMAMMVLKYFMSDVLELSIGRVLTKRVREYSVYTTSSNPKQMEDINYLISLGALIHEN